MKKEKAINEFGGGYNHSAAIEQERQISNEIKTVKEFNEEWDEETTASRRRAFNTALKEAGKITPAVVAEIEGRLGYTATQIKTALRRLGK